MHIPLSAILAPTHAGPSRSLQHKCAVIGPMPATAPLHIARAYLETADLPEFNSDVFTPQERVTIVTGGRSEWHAQLEAQDEEWTRRRLGDRRGMMRRVDIKYCPSAAHMLLLLNTIETPSLVIMWDVLRFEHSQLDDYLRLIAAARALVTQLVVLEPRWMPGMSLPITPPVGREKRVEIAHALQWLVPVEHIKTTDDGYILGGQRLKPSPCGTSPWATSNAEEWRWQDVETKASGSPVTT